MTDGLGNKKESLQEIEQLQTVPSMVIIIWTVSASHQFDKKILHPS